MAARRSMTVSGLKVTKASSGRGLLPSWLLRICGHYYRFDRQPNGYWTVRLGKWRKNDELQTWYPDGYEDIAEKQRSIRQAIDEVVKPRHEVQMSEGPGKFEGEPTYAEHYWNLILEGGADEELFDEGDRPIAYFKIDRADRLRFPYFEGLTRWLSLVEDDSGFVWTEEMTDQRFEDEKARLAALADTREQEETHERMEDESNV